MKQYKIRKSFTYEGQRYYVRGDTEQEVYEKMALKKRDLEEGKRNITKQMLVKDWAKEYMETYKRPSVSAETYQGYTYVFKNHILPDIGNMRLSSVKPIHVQKIVNQMGGGSKKMIDRVAQLTWSMFDTAEANGLIIENPAVRVVKPKGTKKGRRAVTDIERMYSLRLAETHSAGMLIKLTLYCGLRPGEACALQWKNIDFKNKILTVQETIKRCGGTGAPKTSAGNRKIPIPDIFLEDLKRYKKECKWPTDPFDYVLRNNSGGRVSSNVIRNRWKSFKNDLNILMGCQEVKGKAVPPYRVADDLVLYCFRHTYCTDLQDAGVPINVAKELMGHSDISVTSKIYTHSTERSFNAARDMINGLHSDAGLEAVDKVL